MKLKTVLALLGFLVMMGFISTRAAFSSAQYHAELTTYNVQAIGGVPISTNVDLPSTNNLHTGSNGKLPLVNSSGTLNPASSNQFSSFVGYGGSCAPTNWFQITNNAYLGGTNTFSATVAGAMGLPVGMTNVSGTTNYGVAIVMQNAVLGAPYSSAPVAYFFGSVIAPPGKDAYGVVNVTASYWQSVPFTNAAITAQYYYSPNAGLVFATQPGQVQVTWVSATPASAYDLTNYNNTAGAAYPSFWTNGSVFMLRTETYIVSTQPVKAVQRMYWTEGSFQTLGYPVSVPSARVSAIHVAYNTAFPQTVSTPYVDPNVTLITAATNMLQEFRTLWFDPTIKQIRAYNVEGTVFVELLGTPVAGTSASQYLGFEIVSVTRSAQASLVSCNLGDVITPYADGFHNQTLTPYPIDNTLGDQFYFSVPVQNGQQILFADKRTSNDNDLLVYWLSSGVAGLQWPNLLNRYMLNWSSDPSAYSHYLRPVTGSAAQASATGIQLNGQEAPAIDYQDALDQPRGFLTSSNTFYTWLDLTQPAHRALLRFNSSGNVRFERVFSYLSSGIQSNALLAASVVTNLTAWNPTNNTLNNYAAGFNPPYVTNMTAIVGQRLATPSGEWGSSTATVTNYWAGYINTNQNVAAGAAGLNAKLWNSYNPMAYIDPLANGFDAANQGAIIPVNAIPGHNVLEVWWFRSNGATNGFQPVYWPSVIADYSVQWPDAASNQIVLANNQGSGTLSASQSAGTIYTQNDPTLPGYNPNEEHAVMLGAQVYALRDDLNQTNTGVSLPNTVGGYSSAPYVLLSYTEIDGRPAMTVFPVVRENPASGQVFDYVVTAGQPLQAPMPLPLLTTPLAMKPDGTATNYNTEPSGNSGDLPLGWSATLSDSRYRNYNHFTFQDRNHQFWVYRGLHSGLPALQAGFFNVTNNTWSNNLVGSAIINSNYNFCIHVSRSLASVTVNATNVPPGLALLQDPTNGLSLAGVPQNPGSSAMTIALTDTDGSSASVNLSLTVTTNNYVAQRPLVINCTNQYGTVVAFSNRPPTLAVSPTVSNSFTMNYYYPTLPGFAWPGITNPPAVGAIVPYLRPVINGVFVGLPGSSNTASLNIVYRPVWPTLGSDGQSPLPTLQIGQTLTTAQGGLAAVRGQDSVQVLYQQSIALNPTNNGGLSEAAGSVVLFDPETQKTSRLVGGLPKAVVNNLYLGKYYFPNLPPNLVSRFWFDPQTTNLVFTGQYVHDLVSGDYVMLNVLRGDDLAAVNALCPSTDSQYQQWTQAVGGLSTAIYTFTNRLGNYLAYQTNYGSAGDLLAVTNSDTAVTSYAMTAASTNQGYVIYVMANGSNPQYAGDPVSLCIARVVQPLYPGSLVTVNQDNASPFSQLFTLQHTSDLAGKTNFVFDWRIAPPVNGQAPLTDPSTWPALWQANPGPLYTLGASGIQGMSDNWVAMRYGYSVNGTMNWSAYSTAFAPGWIKRVTQNLNPVSGTAQDLFNNPATTTASIISLAGGRWTGDVPLNRASLTNSGLISLYETVLNKGKSLSINAGINYGPANDALLLAAGYLNDFYVTLGNEAWANSLNPTIGFGTENSTYGSIATSQFVFEGQEPTLLEQNLALLRGRDDSLSPGVNLPPVYNHLWWNYTYGLAAGEVMYALNYNITDQNGDGKVNAADAAMVYPQGHGDAYGHYLTALMNYYGLLMNPNFDWVPRATTVNVLGAAVTVNYQDEQKFAASAAALARTGRQIFDQTWRQGYTAGTANGWNSFAASHAGNNTFVNNANQAVPITRYWGLDHWASRVTRGAYLNWVVGNAILPAKDTDPTHQGVQIVDRTTVQDLQEIPSTLTALHNDVDNANAGFTPLGLAQNAIPFDIDPNLVTGANPQTHFEQVYSRAVRVLNNAVTAFNAAQTVTSELRQQQNSLDDLKDAITKQELAYNDQLIDLYGTPYPDDIGLGQPYLQGYDGPDLYHYMYIENPETNTYGGILASPFTNTTFRVSIDNNYTKGISDLVAASSTSVWDVFHHNDISDRLNSVLGGFTNYFVFNIGPDSFLKPAAWQSKRANNGRIQVAAARVNSAQDAYRVALWKAQSDFNCLQNSVVTMRAEASLEVDIRENNHAIALLHVSQNAEKIEMDIARRLIDNKITKLANGIKDFAIFLPTTLIAGTSVGGDQMKTALAAPTAAAVAAETSLFWVNVANEAAMTTAIIGENSAIAADEYANGLHQTDIEVYNKANEINSQASAIQADLIQINQAKDALTASQSDYTTLVSQGDRIQSERLTFRKHAAAKVQGYTVANSAFSVFQNENLQRYTTLFNLAQQYAWMAAQAYDYETGLLGTPAGQKYLNQIISSSALGVVQNSQPQVSGSGTGDPGLANALAEMYADFQVLKGRLGMNNPDGYGTTVSLRQENYRVNADSTGDNNWQQVLQQGLMPDLLADTDVKRNCLGLDDGSGTPVPGIVLTFSTTITDGLNLFGQPLAPGDHSFSSSSYATKLFGVGVCFDGYVGMDNPNGNGGITPPDPTLDPNGLAATPYVYLIPCGADAMRSPPLGDVSTLRTWNVDDVAIPLPFNIGASSFSDKSFYTTSDSLTEPLFAIRKHQAFRPVSTTAAFDDSIYSGGALQRSQYTNQRLIGRSVWNGKWKLIIPGKTLLSDPNQGLSRFIKSVKDVHLRLVTYSYSGN